MVVFYTQTKSPLHREAENKKLLPYAHIREDCSVGEERIESRSEGRTKIIAP